MAKSDTIHLRLPGREVASAVPASAHADIAQLLKIEEKKAVVVDVYLRGAEFETVPFDANPNDVVELEYECGLRQWIRVDQLRDDLQRRNKLRVAAADEHELIIPPDMAAPATRGGGFDLLLKGLKIFGIDPVGDAAKLAVRAAISKFEDSVQPGPGLYVWSDPWTVERQVHDKNDLDNRAPYLLFLHGTASSVSGSFGGLAPAPDAAGEAVSPEDWNALRQKYPGRILGLQHKTLSVSPVQNALDAARLLPEGAQLHLVSHSRGGLIGELLCVNQMPREYRRQRLKTLAVDLFYLQANDLVVHTSAIYGAMERRTTAFYFFNKGPHVNHFHYFRNPGTRLLLIKWLEAGSGQKVEGFRQFVRNQTLFVADPRRAENAGVPRPIVFVVPDLMGTQLKDDHGVLWPSLSGLAKGGLDRLVDSTGRVKSGDLVAELYAPMVNRLQQRYRVEPAGYDWRMGLDEIANELRIRIQPCLEDDLFRKQAIHFVAHGTGAFGLLRLAADTVFWDRFAERNGRIVLLGAPIRGCAAFVLLRDAKASLNRLLRMADHQSKTRPEEIFQKFRSFEEFQPELVQRLGLRKSSELRNLLAIVGKAERTVSCVRDDGAVLYTSAGDGLVTSEASYLDGVPMWQVSAPHGILGSDKLVVDSLPDLLDQGDAPKLQRVTTPPSPADGFPLTLDQPLFFPTEEDLLDAALGGKVRSQFDVEEHPITVSVSHGHLRQARFPVMVGHYVLMGTYGEGSVRDAVSAIVYGALDANRQLDDQQLGRAARAFAERFYQRMLEGERFGDAVLDARQRTHELYPNSNTWGAYQCYGNPDFRLSRARADAPWGTRPRRFASREEILQIITDIASEAAGARTGHLLNELADLRGKIPADWRDGDVLSAFGQAYAQLGKFEEAIAAYRQALADENGKAPVLAAQQIANLLDRLAKKAPEDQQDARLKEALDWFERIAPLADTAELAALRGGYYKRRKHSGDLKLALEAYEKSFEMRKRANSDELYYPGLNAAMLAFLDNRQDGKEIWKQRIRESEEAALRQRAEKRDIWARAGVVDAMLLRSLWEGTLEENQGKIADEYVAVIKGGGSWREIDSILGQIDFLKANLPEGDALKLPLQAIVQKVKAQSLPPNQGE